MKDAKKGSKRKGRGKAAQTPPIDPRFGALFRRALELGEEMGSERLTELFAKRTGLDEARVGVLLALSALIGSQMPEIEMQRAKEFRYPTRKHGN